MKKNLLFLGFYMLVTTTIFSQPSSEGINNIYGYEEVLVLELIAVGTDWSIEVIEVCQGIPTKSVVSDRSIKMDFLDKSGKKMYSVSVGNPKLLQLHTEHNAIPAERDVPTSVKVNVPYDKNCVKVVCSKEEEVKSGTTWLKTFNIKEDVKKAYQEFMKHHTP